MVYSGYETKNKNFYLFAGVNGAGKTTLYNLIKDESDLYGARINSDEIVVKIGHWNNMADQVRAMKEAIKRRNECIEYGYSFNQESTLTGKTILNSLQEIHDAGYTMHLYYIGVASPDIAVARVRERVASGGHDIPEEVIRRRYDDTLKKAILILPLFKEIKIFDNTISPKLCYSKVNSDLYVNFVPEWSQEIFERLRDGE